MILVAHPDDEAIGCGVLLQRIREPLVVFATDGAPRDEYFWKKFGSRARYAEVRHAEAKAALNDVGVSRFIFLDIEDQTLYRNLTPAIAALRALLHDFRPQALLTHAYEGGHPDHDACAFTGAVIGHALALPIWEMPLYQRSQGKGALQTFISGEPELALAPSEKELSRKRRMIERYSSQGLTTASFDLRREVFRRQPAYDFSRPPHEGRLNYEAWRWPMSGADVCKAFTGFSETPGKEMFAKCS